MAYYQHTLEFNSNWIKYSILDFFSPLWSYWQEKPTHTKTPLLDCLKKKGTCRSYLFLGVVKTPTTTSRPLILTTSVTDVRTLKWKGISPWTEQIIRAFRKEVHCFWRILFPPMSFLQTRATLGKMTLMEEGREKKEWKHLLLRRFFTRHR